ncbi:MAG: hypothetical protein ABI609_14380 [Acidobacteriota bacterium]
MSGVLRCCSGSSLLALLDTFSLTAKLLVLALLATLAFIPIAHACGFLAGLIF